MVFLHVNLTKYNFFFDLSKTAKANIPDRCLRVSSIPNF